MAEKTEIKIVKRCPDTWGTYEHWSIFVDGKEVGTASVWNFDKKELEDGEYADYGAYIDRIDIYDGYRNCGYGTTLLKAIDKHYKCDVFICPDSEDSARLYERLGYKTDYFNDNDCGFGVYEITGCSS